MKLPQRIAYQDVVEVKSSNDEKREFSNIQLFRTSLLYQTREFFNNSTLHGVRFIAETGRPFGERFMWFCFTIIGFIAALVIIVSLWEKFQTNPTITGLDMDVHNQQLVFPTVVVCPMFPFEPNRTNELAYNYLGTFDEENTDIVEPFLKYLPQLNYENLSEAYAEAQNITSDRRLENNIDRKPLRALAMQVNIFCNSTFEFCKYRDEEIVCCEHFLPLYSEHGYCYAFNPRYIDTADAEIRNQHFHDLFETDKKWALFFRPTQESKIFVHSHFENFGWDFRPHIVWEPDFAAELLISLKQTYTTEDTKQLSIGQRKCIFPDEVKLDIYNEEYTFTSCMKECRIRKSMKFCHCIAPFYRPIASMPYCKLEQLGCLAKFASNITEVRDCNKCELSCLNIVYDIEKLSKTSGTDPLKPLETFVNIEYLTWPIIKYKREVLFGWVDLLVSFGGIAGLFLGFSLLSGVEIIYYFTLRAFCMVFKSRAELCAIEELKLLQVQKHINLSLKLIRDLPSAKLANPPSQLAKEVIMVRRNRKENNYDGELIGIDQNQAFNRALPRRLNRAEIKLEAARRFWKPIFRQNQIIPNQILRSSLDGERGFGLKH